MMKPLDYLFYPHLCVGCGNSLTRYEKTWCAHCFQSLPRTDFHQKKINPAFIRFDGKAILAQATSFCYYKENSLFRKAVHDFKYHALPMLAHQIAFQYAETLKNQHWQNDIDAIVPVPMHWFKRIQRGYNQTEFIAYGIGQSWQIPVADDLLSKTRYTQSQTRKTFFDRGFSSNHIFKVNRKAKHDFNHILLVDDVLTSGSTLVACWQALQDITPTKISILTLGFAE